MSAAKAIEFGGTDEELERYLLEFARLAGGWSAREKKRTGWIIVGGSLLSTNPNTIPWRVRIARAEGKLALSPSAIALPWTRAKVGRILAYRVGQLADYVVWRARGGGPQKFDPARLREPFSGYGADAAALTASFAWVVAGGIAALLAALVAATLGSIPLMNLAIHEVSERAGILESAGAIALPHAAERAAIGSGFRLGCAFIFAFPLAFLAGVVHALALAGGETSARAARLPQASFLFLAFCLAVAFFPFTPFLALPVALGVPAVTHLGYTLVWGLRGERVREGPRPRPAVVLAGAALAIALVAFLVPSAARGRELQDRLALFRDKALLGVGPGRAFSRAYYRFTLYAADPLKRFFSKDREAAQRRQRIAVGTHPVAAAALRAAGFAVLAAAPARDVAFSEQGVSRGQTLIPVRDFTDRSQLEEALERLADEADRGGPLRDLYGLAWHSMYTAGIPVAVLVFAGICCPFFSIIFRVMTRKAALLTILACLASTGGLMLWAEARQGEVGEKVRALHGLPTPERIRDGLTHRSPWVRHEAAYRAFRMESGQAAVAEALLKAADDEVFQIRIWAVAALGKSGHPRALAVLLGRLKDRELFVRYRAAEGLGLLGNPEAVPHLEEMARTGWWYEGVYALEALRRIAPGKY
jgi:hypothetical protein